MKKYIMCYGDSNTYGYSPHTGFRFPEEIRWTGRVSKILGEEYKIIEEGLNGRTVNLTPPEEIFKNGMYCIEPCVRTHMPFDLLVLMLGSNDMKVIFDQTAEMVGDELRKMIHKIREVSAYKDPQGKPVKILLVSPIHVTGDVLTGPFVDGFNQKSIDTSRQLADVYEKIAKEEDCEYMNAALYAAPGTKDGLHLEEEGHANLAIAMASKIKEIFEN